MRPCSPRAPLEPSPPPRRGPRLHRRPAPGAFAETVAAPTADRWLSELAGWNRALPTLHRPSANPGLGYELIPGARLPASDRHPAISINEQGHRGHPLAPGPGPIILAVGGSNTFGPAADDEGTWPAALERALRSRGLPTAQVLNLGVSGYETQQKVAVLQAYTARATPSLVLVQIHNLGPRYLHPDQTPAEQLRRAPCQLTDWMWVPGHCRGARLLLGTGLRSPLLPLLAHARWRRDDLGDGLPGDAVLLRTFRHGLAALVAAASQRSLPTLLVLPPAGLARPLPDAFAALRETGLPLLDLGEAPAPPLPDWRDPHPSAQAYAVYGERLAELLLAGAHLAPAR